MYIDNSIKNYLSDLAARKSNPGGGSAAALAGASGTALLEMVCNFTIGKSSCKEYEDEIKIYLSKLTKIREELSSLIDLDGEVYSKIREAFKTKNTKIIDDALKEGYYVSRKVCFLSKEALLVAEDLANKGNINLITDIGCGAELLDGALQSGVFNCDINGESIDDKKFLETEKVSLERLKNDAALIYRIVIQKTKRRMEKIWLKQG